MNKTFIQILDKTPIACISVFKNKKISYFNKLAKKQFFSLKKNIHIENIISSKDLNKAIDECFKNTMKKKISFTPENLKDSYFNLELMFLKRRSITDYLTA